VLLKVISITCRMKGYKMSSVYFCKLPQYRNKSRYSQWNARIIYLLVRNRPKHFARPPLFVTTLLSEIIPEPANISDVFASTHYILSK